MKGSKKGSSGAPTWSLPKTVVLSKTRKGGDLKPKGGK